MHSVKAEADFDDLIFDDEDLEEVDLVDERSILVI